MRRIGILGTGMVGRALTARLSGLGVDVLVGARSAGSPSLALLEPLDVRTVVTRRGRARRPRRVPRR